MFEGYTYERLLEDVLNNAPQGIDTRQGSIFFDAVSGILIKIAKLYTDLDLVFELTQIDTTTGSYLDMKASEFALERNLATKAVYNVSFEGVIPAVGERFFTDGMYFTLISINDELYLQAEIPGTSCNDIYAGTAAIPVNNIQGLRKAAFGVISEYGTDDETDDSLRRRIREKIAGPAENGNKQHYKTWCESVEGVGIARIIPLWNGPNTVKAVLINSLGKPCGTSIVKAVQDYVDPATMGYTAMVDGKEYVVGDGLGEGAANLGAHFTAVEAGEAAINVSFDAEITKGTGVDAVIEETKEVLEEYLKNLVLETENADEVIVRISRIGYILSDIKGILDYKNLKINGRDENIIPGIDNVPIIKEVVINVIQ